MHIASENLVDIDEERTNKGEKEHSFLDLLSSVEYMQHISLFLDVDILIVI